ncbi:MAG: Peptidoglycan/xylan/chitin deacetylase, PgdA/CDA1 family [Sporanaerobacter sp.]|jgi:peptidoglycan-N-acetylglucosamine deacetylase|uniref:polysaccharide deacetylase family protein n=1 Tax=Sporanaerobacter sp. TaxID=2010183 RepID=UPI003A0FD00C
MRNSRGYKIKQRKRQRKKRRFLVFTFLIAFILFIGIGIDIGNKLVMKSAEAEEVELKKEEVKEGKEELKIPAEKKIALKEVKKEDKPKDKPREKTEVKEQTTTVNTNQNNIKEEEKNSKEENEKKEDVVEEAPVEEKINENKKIAYLTFDDGPSKNVTPQILDILDKYNIKATFFTIGYLAEQNPELVKREYESGHAIGNHTYSHNYKYVYKSTDNFIADLDKAEKVLKSILGEDFKTNVIRFPGGSHGDKKKPFVKAVEAKGISYVDWNALNGDAEGHNIPKDKLVQRFKSTAKGKNKLIILMHDAAAKKTTVAALPEILDYLISQGYEFRIFDGK